MYTEVIAFWFEEISTKQWWSADPEFDEHIRTRFGALLRQAAQGELYVWRMNAHGRLAEVLVLDQFSRNAYRNSPGAFAQDPMALALAQEAVAAGGLAQLTEAQRTFLLMPYMHSESRFIHGVAAPLFQEHTPPANYEYELKHKAIVDRFGRYPHRNQILGRESTSEELEFLKEPGSRF